MSRRVSLVLSFEILSDLLESRTKIKKLQKCKSFYYFERNPVIRCTLVKRERKHLQIRKKFENAKKNFLRKLWESAQTHEKPNLKYLFRIFLIL